MKSQRFSINMRDLLRGLLMTMIGAFIGGLLKLIESGWSFQFDWNTFQPIVLCAVSAGLSYLLKNYFEDENGDVVVTKNFKL